MLTKTVTGRKPGDSGKNDPGPGGRRLIPPLFRFHIPGGTICRIHMRGDAYEWQGKPACLGFLVDHTPFGAMLASLQESLDRHETILDDVDIHLGEVDLQG